MRLRGVGHILLVGGVILNVLVLLLGIEAGAVLDLWSSLLTLGRVDASIALPSLNRSLVDVGEVAVAEDDGLGVVDAEGLEQGVQGSFLRCSAGVLGTALGVETALVADADAVLVVVEGVGAGEVLVARLVQLAVALYIVVVAGEAEAAVVAGDERGDGERPVLAGRRTVNND